MSVAYRKKLNEILESLQEKQLKDMTGKPISKEDEQRIPKMGNYGD